MNVILLFTIIVGILFVFTLILYLILLKRQGSSNQRELDKLKKLLPQNRKVNKFNMYFRLMYPFIIRIPMIRILAKRVRTRLQLIHAGDERAIRIGTSKLTTLSVSLFVLFIVVAIYVSTSLFTTFGIIIAGFYVGGVLSDILIGRTEKRMLDGFLDLLRMIRNEYQRYRMVKEAIDEARDKSKPLIAVHAEQFAGILDSVDPEEALRKYYAVAPNHFARQIAGLSWIVSELGDSFVNGVSNFLEGLKKIQEEIRLEILRREDLTSHLKGMEAVCIIPLLLLGPMRMWSESFFPFMQDFYNGQLGVLAIVTMFVVTLSCLYIVRSLRSFDNSIKSIFDDNVAFQRLMGFKLFKKLIDRITPNVNTKTHFLVKRRLSNANVTYPMREHYARKVVFGALTFCVVIGVFTYSHLTTRYHMLNPKPIPDESGVISDIVLKRQQFEASAIQNYKEKSLDDDDNKLKLQYDVDQQAYKVPIDEMQAYMDVLISKIEKYKRETLQWYEILIACSLAAGLYWLPDLLLYFRKFMREMEMQNEVDRFYSIISILMNIQRITVIEILEWMHRNSIIFEHQLLKCITDYGSGEWEALESLRNEVNFMPMEQLIERLQQSVENISIQRAFDDLEGERLFAMERRKQKYQHMVAKRVEWAKAIGFIPMRISVAIYLAFPIAYVAYQQFSSTMSDLPQ